MRGFAKFRAWDAERKRFSYFLLHPFGIDIPVESYYPVELHRSDDDELYRLEYKNIEFFQYTGLHDCNGKEIYEGDILDFDEREWGGKFKPEVVYMENIIGDWNYCGSLGDISEWRQVIGNVHENPDLLKP